MSAFWMTKRSLSITFLAISDQYANFIFTKGKYATIFFKWPLTAILEVRFGPFGMNENHFRSFQINTQLLFSQTGNRQLFFLMIWLSVAILDYRKSLSIAFLAISDQYAFFTKWLPTGILDDRKSLLIVFLAISYQYTTFIFCSQNSCRRAFWMTENHFWSHYSPCQINTQLFFVIFFFKMARRPFWKSDLGHFGWSEIRFAPKTIGFL